MADSDKGKLADIIRKKIDTDTFEGKYNASIRKKLLFILLLVLVSAVAIFASVCFGSVDIPPIDLFRVFFHPVFPDLVSEPSESYYSNFVFNGRLPRAVFVILTGFSLGVAGMMMQALLRNPLVSPFTLGVSTAASFGAALAILLGNVIFGVSLMNYTFVIADSVFTFGNLVRVLFAFATALLSILIVLSLSKGNNSRSLVILAGVVISYL